MNYSTTDVISLDWLNQFMQDQEGVTYTITPGMIMSPNSVASESFDGFKLDFSKEDNNWTLYIVKDLFYKNNLKTHILEILDGKTKPIDLRGFPPIPPLK